MNDLVTTALTYYGIREVSGSGTNPVIAKWLRLVGLREIDETAWCSAMLNGIAKEAGYEYTGSPVARSWLKVGEEVRPLDLQLGDVVIYWREAPNSWKGHVGLFIRPADELIYTLGGNQANRINITPYSKGQLLGGRRLRRLPDLVCV